MTTIKELLPYDDGFLEVKAPHHSIRPVGSFRQLLRRPTKFIESLRKYVVGDPVHFIDWKLFAKSDQTLIREIKEESSVKVGVIFDASDCMFWPSAEEAKELSRDIPSKAEIAWRIGLFLSASHLSKGDSLAFGIRTESSIYWIRAPKSKSEVIRLFQSLNDSHFLLPETHNISPPRSLDRIWVLSDGLNGLFSVPKATKFGTLIHTLSSLETHLDWLEDSMSYYDAKAPLKNNRNDYIKDYTAATIAPVYPEKFERWQRQFKEEVANQGLGYLQFSDATSLDSFYKEIAVNGKP